MFSFFFLFFLYLKVAILVDSRLVLITYNCFWETLWIAYSSYSWHTGFLGLRLDFNLPPYRNMTKPYVTILINCMLMFKKKTKPTTLLSAPSDKNNFNKPELFKPFPFIGWDIIFQIKYKSQYLNKKYFLLILWKESLNYLKDTFYSLIYSKCPSYPV